MRLPYFGGRHARGGVGGAAATLGGGAGRGQRAGLDCWWGTLAGYGPGVGASLGAAGGLALAAAAGRRGYRWLAGIGRWWGGVGGLLGVGVVRRGDGERKDSCRDAVAVTKAYCRANLEGRHFLA
jgi:hypothetical protein